MAATKKQIEATRKYKQKHKNDSAYKQKVKVRNKKTNAIRDGRASKPSKSDKCPNCGRSGFRKEFHHTGYGGGGSGEWRCSACNPRPGQTKK